MTNPILAHLEDAFTTKLECDPKPRALRVSSLPFCPILDLLAERERELVDLPSALYTTMGRSMHAGVQTFMSMGNKYGRCVWGSWQCPRCQTFYKNQFRPELCCAVPLDYKEVNFRVGSMTGHLDLLCCYGRKWVAWEFKTNGKPMAAAKRQHLLQVRTYCEMLRICYGITVSAYVVVYIDRGKLKRTVFGPYSNDNSSSTTITWLRRAISGYNAVSTYTKDPTRTNLIRIIKLRPCKSKEDYHAYMARAYDNAGYEDDESTCTSCPLLRMCTRGDQSSYHAVTDCLGESPA